MDENLVSIGAVTEPQFQSLSRIAIALENSKSKDIQALTAAIKELTYSLNTFVISNLATTEEERQRVLDRVM